MIQLPLVHRHLAKSEADVLWLGDIQPTDHFLMKDLCLFCLQSQRLCICKDLARTCTFHYVSTSHLLPAMTARLSVRDLARTTQHLKSPAILAELRVNTASILGTYWEQYAAVLDGCL